MTWIRPLRGGSWTFRAFSSLIDHWKNRCQGRLDRGTDNPSPQKGRCDPARQQQNIHKIWGALIFCYLSSHILIHSMNLLCTNLLILRPRKALSGLGHVLNEQHDKPWLNQLILYHHVAPRIFSSSPLNLLDSLVLIQNFESIACLQDRSPGIGSTQSKYVTTRLKIENNYRDYQGSGYKRGKEWEGQHRVWGIQGIAPPRGFAARVRAATTSIPCVQGINEGVVVPRKTDATASVAGMKLFSSKYCQT